MSDFTSSLQVIHQLQLFIMPCPPLWKLAKRYAPPENPLLPDADHVSLENLAWQVVGAQCQGGASLMVEVGQVRELAGAGIDENVNGLAAWDFFTRFAAMLSRISIPAHPLNTAKGQNAWRVQWTRLAREIREWQPEPNWGELQAELEEQKLRLSGELSPLPGVQKLETIAQEVIAELGALKRLANDYIAALDNPNRNEPRLKACEQVLGEWRGRNQGKLPSYVEILRPVPVVRESAVVISGHARKSALSWLVELGDRAREWVLHKDYSSRIDITARWLVGELGIDLGRMAAEVGVELDQRTTKNEQPTGDGVEWSIAGKRKTKATINARMIDTLQNKSDAIGWTAAKWSRHLHCSASAIVGTNVWKSMKLDREKGKAERRNDRNRKKRHYGNSE